MKKNFKLVFAGISLILILVSACTKKLDLKPTNAITADQVYSTPAGYKTALAKVYLAMAMPGNVGNHDGTQWGGQPDIPPQILSDEGNSDFIRGYWYLQELTTDEAGWTYFGNTDPLDIHQMQWTASNQTVAGSYYRSIYQITLANDFIRQSSDANLSTRGISGTDADNIRRYKAEARFLRAYQYWVLMDLYGNPPFITDSVAVGSSYIPPQIQRTDLFNYIESELKAIDGQLAAPHSNEYGRADQAAEWALLARMYLNAGVYTGTQRYSDAITYCNKVIGAGYTLHSNYKELMLADNNLNTDEFIFVIPFDGTRTQTYGGTTLLAHAPAGVPGDSSGTNGNWNCIRITQQFVSLFDGQDIRGQFWSATQKLSMDTLLGTPADGYSSTKFRNKTRSGGPAPDRDAAGNFADIDFPLFRLGEIYLTYAEAVLRGGTGGDNATALSYLSKLSVRARPNDPNASSYPQLTLPYIITERGRELFWEMLRRTDLIRFGQFTTSAYLWAWKGNVANGTAVDSKYNVFPIPSLDLTANPNLKQNPGY
jgi:hypothetical protein